ncbi:FprA family A-type flavoprotein [Methylomonas sp. EFPC1]|uniref:FprA family A-type flavoprotein n=1 Tax=Methylomonas defluvii TaxID=3045149 RepID=A0ABU4UA52_9GAMM|nr:MULTISPECIES: FprA family A-type flavoprotein [unclassified Methylomonas]MDX8126058.1 FprA family A-type flavoprotein [Methylomonas sp. OY6]QBC26149.1 FprA family A-type flavoprotein [Methylomonas sp. LW13]QSB02058.1 FprA family A-type flavoprotein [Methylomonas sp. EFPC1]
MNSVRLESEDGVPLAVALSERVHWVGALDPNLRTFDIILKTANGTSYNAYVIRGSEGVAVIDTVKEGFANAFFARLESVADYSEIKVIVLNHLEPDHTGALPELMKRAPHAQLFISQKAQSMLKGLLKQDELSFTPVLTGDKVSLGDRSLEFLHTPYLHWPDTQCTYAPEEAMLFSGDVFGCHFCDNRLYNDKVGDFRFSFEYYYAHIMRPFKEYVVRALELIEPLPLKLIAPTHGPILRDRPQHYIQRYRQLSSPALHNELRPNQKTLLIFYISSYGNTRRMAEAIYQGAMQVEDVRVSLYDLEGGEVAPFVDLIEEADGLVLGTPTINGDAVKPIWDLLSSLAVVNLKNKLGGVFGSYGWTGEGVRLVEDRLRGLKLRVPIQGLRVKLIPTDDEIHECKAFGLELAQELTGARESRVINFADL